MIARKRQIASVTTPPDSRPQMRFNTNYGHAPLEELVSTQTPTLGTPSRSGLAPLLPAANVIAYLVTVTINALANTLPIGGADTGELSDRFPSLFTPTGFTFSIWGLIYLLLGVFVVYQLLPAQRNNPLLQRLGWWFVISCAANVAWIFAWHYQVIALSELLMLALLLSLIVAYERLGIGREAARSRLDEVALRLPFRIYLGWITVATVANTSILLLDLGFDGGRLAPLYAVIAVTAALGIGLTVLARRHDVPYALVLVWAFIGIAVARWPGAPNPAANVAVAALVAAGVMLGAALWETLARSKGHPAT